MPRESGSSPGRWTEPWAEVDPQRIAAADLTNRQRKIAHPTKQNKEPIIHTLEFDKAPPALPTSQPIVRRLGDRLNHLYQWAQAAGPYTDIWDLCCDHGRLGLHLHQAQHDAYGCTRSRIHLVDCVPSIIDDLKIRYAQWPGDDLSIDCRDSGDIELPNTGRQLLILAGVGGGTVVDILTRLLSSAGSRPLPPIDFLLSPNLKVFELRSFLREHNFELLQEEFVSEKGWHHEHMHLRLHADCGGFNKPSLVGDSLWNPLTAEKTHYIKTQIEHYRNRVKLGSLSDFKVAVDAYQALIGGS